MTKAPPSFAFFYNDWLGGTRHLTHIDRSCYLDLLIYQWQNGHIPEDPHVRAELCGVGDQDVWRAIWVRLKDKFAPKELSDGRTVLVNERMREDREEAIEEWLRRKANEAHKSEVRRQAANKRWKKHREKCKSDAIAMQTDASREEEVLLLRKEDSFREELLRLPTELRSYVNDTWLAYRKEIKKPYTKIGIKKLVNRILELEASSVMAAMDKSIRENYQGWEFNLKEIPNNDPNRFAI